MGGDGGGSEEDGVEKLSLDSPLLPGLSPLAVTKRRPASIRSWTRSSAEEDGEGGVSGSGGVWLVSSGQSKDASGVPVAGPSSGVLVGRSGDVGEGAVGRGAGVDGAAGVAPISWLMGVCFLACSSCARRYAASRPSGWLVMKGACALRCGGQLWVVARSLATTLQVVQMRAWYSSR